MRKRAAVYAVNSICVARGPGSFDTTRTLDAASSVAWGGSSLAPPEAIAPLLGADAGPRSEGP